jgi:hypothetical protein
MDRGRVRVKTMIRVRARVKERIRDGVKVNHSSRHQY